MDDAAQRMRRELRGTLDLICRIGGAVVFEEFPGALREELPGACGGTDASRARAAPDPAASAHDTLLAAADALAVALAQLDAVVPRRHAGSTTS